MKDFKVQESFKKHDYSSSLVKSTKLFKKYENEERKSKATSIHPIEKSIKNKFR